MSENVRGGFFLTLKLGLHGHFALKSVFCNGEAFLAFGQNCSKICKDYGKRPKIGPPLAAKKPEGF